jgi:DNA replication initiation complex subunit (GINS family)
MEKTVITYETIYESVRNEKNNQELQQLSETFFADIARYLKDKRQILEDTQKKSDLFSKKEVKKITLQIENTQNLLTDMYARREQKILQLAINMVRTQSDIVDTTFVHPVEQEFFQAIMGTLEQYRGSILAELLKENVPAGSPPASEVPKPTVAPATPPPSGPPVRKKLNPNPTIPANARSIEFVDDMDIFIDKDLNQYGPYTMGDRAAIPPECAEILIAQGKAKAI